MPRAKRRQPQLESDVERALVALWGAVDAVGGSLVRLHRLRAVRQAITGEIERDILVARAEGATWTEIGAALAINERQLTLLKARE